MVEKINKVYEIITFNIFNKYFIGILLRFWCDVVVECEDIAEEGLLLLSTKSKTSSCWRLELWL